MEEVGSRPLEAVPLTPIEQLREDIASLLAAHDPEAASAAYLRLIELDQNQVLTRPHQLEIANYLAQTQRYRAAAAAYEAFLAAYPGSSDVGVVRLFLGLIYNRYLRAYDRAAYHLRQAVGQLTDEGQRGLAEQELERAETALSGQQDLPAE